MPNSNSPDSFDSFSASLDGLDQGVGLSNPILSQDRRVMLDLINRLHSTGVQVDLDLPQIAVIGSQSAGKSSLIESISGITLPRAAGTCTRCPTECRLSRSTEPWKCVVSLRFITNAKGQTLGQARNETFGETIVDKSKVEERIRRAQRAILNPSTPSVTYLKGVDEDIADAELSFSSNYVSLQISGPEVADLSFCDLPGLIASVSGGGNTNDITLVQDLVTSYIKKPSCIILLTVACETDFENQGAHRLAKFHDPDGKRTIGVLTKPDRIPQGEESNWLPFIRNEKEPLENNWYCVKQPNSVDLKQGITWADARRREDEFFSITSPWSELDASLQGYLRTSNLVDRLSFVLYDLIAKRLPQIQDELEKAISAAQQSLNELPKEPPQDPLNAIANLLHVFATDLSKHVEGVPDKEGLLQLIRPQHERFRKAIRVTAPDFRPFERRFSGRYLPPVSFLSNEEESDGNGDVKFDNDEQKVERLRVYEEAVSPTYFAPAEIVEEEPYEVPSISYKSPATYEPSVSVVENNNNISENDNDGYESEGSSPVIQEPIYVDEVFTWAQHARTRELPGNYPFVVQQTYITAIVEKWEAPAMALCGSVHRLLGEQVKKLVTKHFAAFGTGSLEQRVRIILQEHVKRCTERTEECIEWILRLEDRPFTLNTHYLADYKGKFYAYYKGARVDGRNSELMKIIRNYINQQNAPHQPYVSHRGGYAYAEVSAPTGIAKVLAGLAEMGIHDIKPEELPKLLPSDQMEPALNIMADVRAYFQVAYKRFVDNVPLTIDYELVLGVQRDAIQALYTGLGINGPDGHRLAKELAQESSHIASRRAELKKKLERLNIANAELLRIGL